MGTTSAEGGSFPLKAYGDDNTTATWTLPGYAVVAGQPYRAEFTASTPQNANWSGGNYSISIGSGAAVSVTDSSSFDGAGYIEFTADETEPGTLW
ncbi:MAG: hypothetical protein R3C99_00755 [Pirellulaceae bacterium]